MRFIEKYDIEAMARAAYRSGVHLADDRMEWLQLMMSMAGGGEQLLDSFLLLASTSSKFKERESRREFLKAVRKSSDVGLKFFIDRCKEIGISPDDYLIHSNFNHQPSTNMQTTYVPIQNIERIQTIDPEWVVKFGKGQDSTFHSSVVATGQLTAEELQAASELFRLGTTRDKRVIYWQIDNFGHVRDGKLMAYDERCHRVKSIGKDGEQKNGISWASYEFRKLGKLAKDWKATHCLFGLHQLNMRPEATVCIVEAEKTAVICSQKLKDCIWMATGGMGALNIEVLRPLEGRQVIVYPDTDTEGKTYSKWSDIAWQAKLNLGLDIVVSDVLERNATPEQKEAKIDIADFIAEDIAEENTTNEDSTASGEVAKTTAESAPATAEAAPVADKTTQIQKIINNQAEIKEAMNKTPQETLREMAEDYPAVGHLDKAFVLKLANTS